MIGAADPVDPVAAIPSVRVSMVTPAEAVAAAGPAVPVATIITTAVMVVLPIFHPACRMLHSQQATEQDTTVMAGA